MNILENCIPAGEPADLIRYAAENIKVCGHSFDPSRAPQIEAPIRAMLDSRTRIGTLIKPVQACGSTGGEVASALWCRFRRGLFQFNWQNDEKAKERWSDRILPAIQSIKDMPYSGERYEETVCELRLPSITLRCQGVFTEGNLDSDTVDLQINEEIHLWKPGYLQKARGRQTRVWNCKAFDISNASKVGDQLFLAFEDGTMRWWESKCPKCGLFHPMHFRYDPDHPERGGLRWDSDGCKMPDGKFNYPKLRQTIRYQMPVCGHEIIDTSSERKALVGQYSEPTNKGADLTHESWTFEGVSVAEIPWLTLIKEWHTAIRAMRAGDIQPMYRFVTERECRFWSDELIPYSGVTIYNQTLKKNRTGLPNRAYRSATADWQQGYKAKGELQHYWLLIEDVLPNCDSQIVFEGMVESDSELIAEVDAHHVPHSAVWIDCSKNTKAILQLCYQNGFNAINLQLSRVGSFLHDDGVRRFYSKGKPIHMELNTPPVFPPVAKRNPKNGNIEHMPAPEEPTVVSLNKAGMLSNHFFIRNMRANVLAAKPDAKPEEYISVEIPADVSEDFKKQNEAWEYLPGHKPKNSDDGVEGFKQRSRNDHLLMCRAYQDFLKEWTGLLGDRLTELGLVNSNEQATNEAD